MWMDQAGAHAWSVRQLEMHVQEGLFERVTGTYAELPPLPRGRLYTYPVVANESGHTRLNLGFGIHCGPAVVALNAVVPGDMAESRGAEPPATVPFAAHRVGWTDDEANTYLARVRRVVDGDTLVVTVDLGFAVEVGQTLRLRGIDAPELSRQAGERAREFVRQALSAPSAGGDRHSPPGQVRPLAGRPVLPPQLARREANSEPGPALEPRAGGPGCR